MNPPRMPLRWIGWGVALLLLALPVTGLLRGWFASDHWPIRQLKIEASYQHVSADAIRAAVVPVIGQGFFATDVTAVQQAVAALPWVAKVVARKHWPDELVIRVREHQAMAHWNTTSLVDRQGKLFQVPDADAVTGLPVLAGPDKQLQQVLAFYARSTAQLAHVGLRVTAVDLDPRGGWRVGLGHDARLVIGRTRPWQRLERFIAVYPQLAALHAQGFRYADLRYTNGFAVRWANAAPATAAPTGGSGA